ncbi:MAG: hypothetical protein NUV96_02580, partial [Candidatus Colwellbacteria bacterium]|nr:hypothetical protein [Candidatus Colwellbacteria bacterium]
ELQEKIKEFREGVESSGAFNRLDDFEGELRSRVESRVDGLKERFELRQKINGEELRLRFDSRLDTDNDDEEEEEDTDDSDEDLDEDEDENEEDDLDEDDKEDSDEVEDDADEDEENDDEDESEDEDNDDNSGRSAED